MLRLQHTRAAGQWAASYGNILQPIRVSCHHLERKKGGIVAHRKARDDLYIIVRPHGAVAGVRFFHDMEENMAHTPFIVFREQGQWAIKSNGVHHGPYATQRDAIRAAVDAAYAAGEKGLNGQVLIENQFRVEWTYGKDPYPPNSSDYL